MDAQWQHQHCCLEFVGAWAVAATSKKTDNGWRRGFHRSAELKVQVLARSAVREPTNRRCDLNALLLATEIDRLPAESSCESSSPEWPGMCELR